MTKTREDFLPAEWADQEHAKSVQHQNYIETSKLISDKVEEYSVEPDPMDTVALNLGVEWALFEKLDVHGTLSFGAMYNIIETIIDCRDSIPKHEDEYNKVDALVEGLHAAWIGSYDGVPDLVQNLGNWWDSGDTPRGDLLQVLNKKLDGFGMVTRRLVQDAPGLDINGLKGTIDESLPKVSAKLSKAKESYAAFIEKLEAIKLEGATNDDAQGMIRDYQGTFEAYMLNHPKEAVKLIGRFDSVAALVGLNDNLINAILTDDLGAVLVLIENDGLRKVLDENLKTDSRLAKTIIGWGDEAGLDETSKEKLDAFLKPFKKSSTSDILSKLMSGEDTPGQTLGQALESTIEKVVPGYSKEKYERLKEFQEFIEANQGKDNKAFQAAFFEKYKDAGAVSQLCRDLNLDPGSRQNPAYDLMHYANKTAGWSTSHLKVVVTGEGYGSNTSAKSLVDPLLSNESLALFQDVQTKIDAIDVTVKELPFEDEIIAKDGIIPEAAEFKAAVEAAESLAKATALYKTELTKLKGVAEAVDALPDTINKTQLNEALDLHIQAIYQQGGGIYGAESAEEYFATCDTAEAKITKMETHLNKAVLQSSQIASDLNGLINKASTSKDKIAYGERLASRSGFWHFLYIIFSKSYSNTHYSIVEIMNNYDKSPTKGTLETMNKFAQQIDRLTGAESDDLDSDLDLDAAGETKPLLGGGGGGAR